MKNKKMSVSYWLIAALLMVVGMSACQQTPEDTTTGNDTPPVVVVDNDTSNLDDGSIRPELTSLEVVDLMGLGINLSNTMEAYGRSAFGVGRPVRDYETHWGQPETTQEIIDFLKASGFDALRIPVAWTNAMAFETGDYTIGDDYLARVEEIIHYARNAGMYVVINDHWDGGWWGMFGSANPDTRAAAMDIYVAMWTQISERYNHFSDFVMFESANEELGFRLNDKDIAADSGTLNDDECFEMTNLINQTFVDVVRGTGGNNASRFLLIAGFNTNINLTIDERFEMPTDTVDNKLIIKVHYYDPDGYCINISLSTWGTEKDYTHMNEQLKKMEQFTRMGYGVVLGEYAVMVDRDGTPKANTLDWHRNFLNNCALYGYHPMLWDTSQFYVRHTLSYLCEDFADFYKSRSRAARARMTRDEIEEAAFYEMRYDLSNARDAGRLPDNIAMAWLMYNSGDWAVIYSVGDDYNPEAKTGGVEATDVEITGPGIYTVALDFTDTIDGFANSIVFSAIGIANGEALFPGYVIDILEIVINGEVYEMIGRPYTATDDGKTTRLNLYNHWVTAIPNDIRTVDGITAGVTTMPVAPEALGKVYTISITFDFQPGE
ncbi:MAG: glycoside hydrolase family 5 protein [Lachnospiraceae bacterium]|nr:glycoside hydrolase family 5 protein [Lachnospiraceae bacterium]